MGIFDFLFKSKQKNAHPEPKSPQEEIEVSEWDNEYYHISLNEYDYRGKAFYSPNKKFIASGNKNRVVFVDVENKTVLFDYDIFKNVDFTSIRVTDHPFILVRDIISIGDNLTNDFYILNKRSDIVFRSNVNAHIYCMGISSDGKYACIQTCNECEIIVYDIELQKIFHKWIPTINGLTSEINVDPFNMIITLSQYGENFDYTFKGDFLDQQKWYEYRKNCSIPTLRLNVAYEIIDALFKTPKNEQLLSDYQEALSIIDSALEIGVYDKDRAFAYRKIGEVYDKVVDYKNALENYKKAISLNEKVGVKRRINTLEKIINS
ncbi:MAG TPA: tetratricopeptide repeat protein [Bacillus bacterium]|nr:tetratricopeptide repeat protein [Bacillus sp. (in: firmicutes)]